MQSSKKKCLTDLVEINPFPGQSQKAKKVKAAPSNGTQSAPVPSGEPVKKYNLDKEVTKKIMEKPVGTLRTNNPSIQQIINPPKKGDEEILDPGKMPVEDFSYDEFIRAWNKFARKMKEDGRESMFTTLSHRKPILDNTTVFLQIDNAIQAQHLEDEKLEILDFLRKSLRNYSIGFEYEIVTDSSKSIKFQTPKDKFLKMSEDNPSLLKLQKLFNLDIDF